MNEKLNVMFQTLIIMLENLSFYVTENDIKNKNTVNELEEEIDNLEFEIENHILELFSLQQPQHEDLKLLLCISRVIRDLERIGDQIMNFYNMYGMIKENLSFIKENIKQILELEIQMINEIFKGISIKNKDALTNAILLDDQVDHLHITTFRKIVLGMKESEIDIDTGSKLVIMIRFLERLGDHIVNIGESYGDYFRISEIY